MENLLETEQTSLSCRMGFGGKKRKRRLPPDKIFVCVMLAIPVLHFIIFWVFVNVDTVFMSFQRFDYATGGYKMVGFANFAELFREFGNQFSKLGEGLRNSVILFFWNNLIIVPISLLFAFILHRNMVLPSVFRVIFFLPSIISVVVLTMVFSFMFDSSIGFVNALLEKLNLRSLIPEFGWLGDDRTAFPMLLFYGLWSGIGANIVLLNGAIKRLPAEMFEATKIDGVSMWRELFSFVIPLIGTTLSTLLLIGTTVMSSYFLQPMLLTGGQAGTYTLGLYIVVKIKNSANLTLGAAAGILVALFSIPVVLLVRVILNKCFPAYEY